MRILIVDDDPVLANAMTRLLADLAPPHSFVVAGGGEEALAICAEAPCDVAFVDLRMPGMSGLELLERIAARWPSTFRVVLSGSMEEERTDARQPLAHVWLTKPCRAQVLRDTIALAERERASH